MDSDAAFCVRSLLRLDSEDEATAHEFPDALRKLPTGTTMGP